MSAVNQKDYLKRYLSKDKHKKKKKKVPKGIAQNRVKIIDDNIDVLDQQQTIQDIENADEDAPQVVAVIDDRPVELRMSSFKDSSNWTAVDIKPKIKQEFESPERNGNTGDTSPPRRRRRDDDESPPRRGKNKDGSPPRRRRRSDDTDESPPRKKRSMDDSTPPRIKKEDQSLSRKKQRRYSDESPPRRRRRSNSDVTPPRRTRKNYSDEGPPRKGRPMHDSIPQRIKKEDQSSSRTKQRRNSDASPPRRNNNANKSKNDDYSPRRRSKGANSPRARRNDNDSSPRRRKQEDESPIRDRKRGSSPRSRNARNHSKKSRWASRSPSPKSSTSKYANTSTASTSKATKTLDGKTAGLQNAKDLVKETENFRKRESKLFQDMAADVSGVNASTVMRDRKTGRVRDLEAEAEVKSAQKDKSNELQKKYDQWGKGVKQTADYKQNLEQTAYEMSKPLARYADDEDLERHLKEQERAGDPMLAYIKKKKKDDAVKAGVKLKPEYMGEFMPNRYGIRPGHRWDGVDRSNGYEKKWFDAINKRNAEREEAYRWNSEDM